MKFSFARTVHCCGGGQLPKLPKLSITLIDNCILGEKYRYVLSIRWKAIAYHFSVFAPNNYNEEIEKWMAANT